MCEVTVGRAACRQIVPHAYAGLRAVHVGFEKPSLLPLVSEARPSASALILWLVPDFAAAFLASTFAAFLATVLLLGAGWGLSILALAIAFVARGLGLLRLCRPWTWLHQGLHVLPNRAKFMKCFIERPCMFIDQFENLFVESLVGREEFMHVRSAESEVIVVSLGEEG
jgi:hypothetical protein